MSEAAVKHPPAMFSALWRRTVLFARRTGRYLDVAQRGTGANAISRWVEPYNVLMAAMFVGGALVAWFVLPGDDERIAALEQDGQIGRALALAEARYAQNDRRPRLLYQLQKYYEFYGERDKARSVLEQLAVLRPKDGQVQRQLAQLYKQTQDEPRYIKALRSQLALAPRNPDVVCRELIGLLRRNSLYAEEQSTISECRGKGYRRQDDLVRYAFLSAADGNFAEASQTLKAVDDRRWLSESRERLMLFSSLLEVNQAPEALRRSIRWLRGQPDPDLALEMISLFTAANRNELALSLARQVGAPGDAITLAVAEIMVDQVQLAPARLYLAGWLDQKKPMDAEVATRFVTTAIDAEDPVLALRGAEQFGLSGFDQSTLAALAEAVAGSAMGAGFDRIIAALTAETIAARPLIAAASEVRSGRTDAARSILSQIRLDALDERQQQTLATLSLQSGRSAPLSGFLRPPPSLRPALDLPTGPIAADRRVIGPAQAKVKSILRRVEAKRVKQKRRAERAPVAASGPGGFVPMPFPTTSQP
jgi:tetratricopeptide (TPR) repeat protein